MTPLLLRLFAVTLLLLVSLAVDCGDDDDSNPTTGLVTQTPNLVPSVGGPQDQPEPAQPLDAEAIEATDGTVEISASGSQYSNNHIRMNAGDAVIIRVTNEDEGI